MNNNIHLSDDRCPAERPAFRPLLWAERMANWFFLNTGCSWTLDSLSGQTTSIHIYPGENFHKDWTSAEVTLLISRFMRIDFTTTVSIPTDPLQRLTAFENLNRYHRHNNKVYVDEDNILHLHIEEDAPDGLTRSDLDDIYEDVFGAPFNQLKRCLSTGDEFSDLVDD